VTCSGCVSLSGAALDRYAAALVELRERRRYSREEIARLFDVPLVLLPEEETS
jgi:hypothetical protein